MRITNGYFSNTMLHSLQKSNGKVADLMAQINSGYRVQRPSDDPIAAVQLLLIDRDQTMLGQYRDNIGSLSLRMQQNELRLDSMLKNVHSAHDMMVWAADGTNAPGDLNAMAITLRTLRDNLLTEANATDGEGRYLFSGTKSDTPAISYDPDAPPGSRYSFSGNTDKQQVVVGQGVTESANVSADGMEDMLNQLDAALALLEDPDVNVNDPATRAQLVECLEAMNDGIGTISSKIAMLGGAQNTLELMDDHHASMEVANGQAAQMIGELDFVEAYDRLNSYVVAVQASYQVYGRIMQLSPFDAILR
ncbi:flagellar hook-associated protein FlgL [Dyella jejuensis]|uniref:Flagellar hook-associated protein FlgL n=1 Tax=Dyella jejuensis TaxID=1432009 RepID=A0ABW8JHC5_9GAMM